MSPASSRPSRSPRCQTCGRPSAWRDNPHRPFCGLVCRLVDLGTWLDERYRLAGEPVSTEGTPGDRVPPSSG